MLLYYEQDLRRISLRNHTFWKKNFCVGFHIFFSAFRASTSVININMINFLCPVPFGNSAIFVSVSTLMTSFVDIALGIKVPSGGDDDDDDADVHGDDDVHDDDGDDDDDDGDDDDDDDDDGDDGDDDDDDGDDDDGGDDDDDDG